MSSDQQTAESSLLAGSFQGSAPPTARYVHRRFRNAPKKQRNPQQSLAISDSAKIQDADCNNASVSKPFLNPNTKEKGK